MSVILFIIIISGFGIYGAAVVPDSGIGNTWQCLTLVLHEFLSNGLTPSRLHIVISFLTHADHIFLGLPRSLKDYEPRKCVWWQQNCFCVWQSSERSGGMVSSRPKKCRYAVPSHFGVSDSCRGVLAIMVWYSRV